MSSLQTNWRLKAYGVIIIVIIFDQLSKYSANRLDFQIVMNQGISFGWRPAGDGLTILLLLLVSVLLLVSWRYWYRAPIAVGLFFGGVSANLIDRLMYGGVRDWLPIPFVGLYNNLADWAIFTAVTLLLYQSIRTGDERQVSN